MSGAGQFPTTHWSMILEAGEAKERRQAALAELAEAYWTPLYVYVRRKGRDAAEAEDVVQGFYERLLGGEFLARLDPGKGRFRSYLRAAMDRYLINLHERETAAKRGGGRKALSLDVAGIESRLANHPISPEQAFDRAWAIAVVDQAQAWHRQEHEEAGRAVAFEVAAKFVGIEKPPSYAEAAKEAGMTAPQFRSFLFRFRRRFQELVRREVAPTVAARAEIGDEVAELLGALES